MFCIRWNCCHICKLSLLKKTNVAYIWQGTNKYLKKKGSADLLTRSLKFVTSDDQYLYFKAYKYFNKLQTEVGKDEREVSMKVNMFIKCSLLHFPQDIVEKYISNIYINYIDFLWSKKINICSGYLTCSSLSVVFPTCCLLSCYSVKVLTNSTSVVFSIVVCCPAIQ